MKSRSSSARRSINVQIKHVWDMVHARTDKLRLWAVLYENNLPIIKKASYKLGPQALEFRQYFYHQGFERFSSNYIASKSAVITYLAYVIRSCLTSYMYDMNRRGKGVEANGNIKCNTGYYDRDYNWIQDEITPEFTAFDTEDTSVEDSEVTTEIFWRKIREYLTEEEYQLIRDTYVEGATLGTLGDRAGLSRERMRQKKVKTLLRLRKFTLMKEFREDMLT